MMKPIILNHCCFLTPLIELDLNTNTTWIWNRIIGWCLQGRINNTTSKGKLTEKLSQQSKKKDKYKKYKKGSKNKLKQTAKQCISSKTAEDDSESELIKPEDEESLHYEEITTADDQPHQSPTQITTVATVSQCAEAVSQCAETVTF